MKVTRVILVANDDPKYYQFWNPISKIYKLNFGISPILILFGNNADIYRLKLCDHYGQIIVQEPMSKHHIGWQSTWAMFWFMKIYPDDIFVTMGIDQVPLSNLLIKDLPREYSDDTYLMLADDGYAPQHWSLPSGTSPSSFHIVKGSVADEVYGFEPTFEAELDKVANAGIVPYYDKDNKWGLDESYSSHKLRQYWDGGGRVVSGNLFNVICERRIECCRLNEAPYDENKLKMGWYGDAHFCRPVSEHQVYIDKLLSLIPS